MKHDENKKYNQFIFNLMFGRIVLKECFISIIIKICILYTVRNEQIQNVYMGISLGTNTNENTKLTN